MLKTKDFDFNLPKELIAQKPIEPRDHSRLLAFHAQADLVEHKKFYDICDYLKAGDTLVLNRSKVIPARLIFDCEGKECEIFLLKNLEGFVYQALVRPGKLFKVGRKHIVADGLECGVKEVSEEGTRVIEFSSDPLGYGLVPLPPYIENDEKDVFEKYQTVFAKEEGSVAAPTAGLHFTDALLEKLKAKGVEIAEVVLHVGLGTFLPVKSELLDEHKMHSEDYFVSEEAAAKLNKCVEDGRRIVAVGTTSVRVLESIYDEGFKAGEFSTNIFIYPGRYEWKVVDALITNFHLPKSTLIMLVASFLESKGVKNSVERILNLYEEAIKEKYRFYSFGDATFIY